jgi:hypothetical protein
VAIGSRTHLTLYLTGGYLLLIVYASLYPLTGWRDSGGNPLDFLGAAWPRYYTGFDLATNIAAYLPFGFLCAAALRRNLAACRPGCWRPCSGGALSLVDGAAAEATCPTASRPTSTWPATLPRALLGAWLARRGRPTCWSEGRLADWRRQTMMHGYGADIGVLLVAAWLMTQLSPESLLFGSGNLRQMLDLPPVQPFLAERFISVEAPSPPPACWRPDWSSRCCCAATRAADPACCCLAVLVKTAAHALLMGRRRHWPGSRPATAPAWRSGWRCGGARPSSAPLAARSGGAGAAVRHRDGQCRAGKPLPAQHAADLEPRPVPQLQRPDAPDFLALALPRPALADDLPTEKK